MHVLGKSLFVDIIPLYFIRSSFLVFLFLFLSYDFAQKIEKTSRGTNKKNNMINVNEDINKNIISIISYKKAILHGVKLKYVQICLLSTYFIVSIILLK